MKLYEKLNISEFLYKKIVEKLGRTPNDFETYLFSAMHCEHCGYMHSKKYLKDFYTENNFEEENSGCIKIKNFGIFFKMESHNHPCAVEPYQGSMTGIGGIVRDVLSLGARPIALLNSLKFSNLNDNKTKYYLEEVTRGISDYGNSIGVPTVGGETIFDKNFEDIPIVNVFALGIANLDEIKLSKAKKDALIVLLGSKTGVDGLNGANFASNTHGEKKSRNSVQIGDPYTKKKLIEAVLELNKLPEVIACQDLGASGILSSTSEMGYKGNCSIELYLDKVHTQIENITPQEIMLSESQERMAYILDKKGINKFSAIAKKYELEFSIIGKTKEGNSYKIYNNDELLCDLDLKVLCEPYLYTLKEKEDSFNVSKEQTFDEFINSDNFSSKKYVYSQFDQEVQGRTCFSQKENSIGILYLKETNSFMALDCKTCFDNNPKIALQKTFKYLYRKLVSVGFEPKGLTNCLNFANPDNPDVQSDFIKTTNELKRLSHLYKTPVVSGNVSFYNEKHNEKGSKKIPPCATLAFVGVCEDKKQILNNKIEKNDEIFFLKEKDLIEEKEIIFNLIKKGKIKKALPVGSSGLVETLLKQSLFYNLGFKIKTKEKISYILITDKKEKLENYNDCFYGGKFIDDKIIFDEFSYDKKELKKIFENKIPEKMK